MSKFQNLLAKNTSLTSLSIVNQYCPVKIVFPDKICLYSFGGMILSNSQKAFPSIKYHYFDPEGGRMYSKFPHTTTFGVDFSAKSDPL